MIPTVMNPIGISPYGRRLQYIASTGTQYIDTGVKPDFAGGDSVEISFYRASYPEFQPCVFGCRETANTNGFYVLPHSIALFGTTQNSITWNSTIGDYTMSLDDSNITVNGNVLAAMPTRVTCTMPIFIFVCNNYGTPEGSRIYADMKLYDWKYYRNGTLAQHLVPVLDKSGVPCMYDTVTHTLVYNAGTGTFNYS